MTVVLNFKVLQKYFLKVVESSIQHFVHITPQAQGEIERSHGIWKTNQDTVYLNV